MKKTKLVLALISGLTVLFACLGFLGYFGFKTLRRNHLRMEAREAFAAEDWENAEKLLKQYVEKDPDSEEDYVFLAQVYRHFGNAEEEMRCWARVVTLNPLKPEYRKDYTASALTARDFGHLYSTLRHKLILNEELSPKDQKLYIICAVITNHIKEAEQYCNLMTVETPDLFQQDDLGRFAEFLVTYQQHSPGEHSLFLDLGVRSDDSFVRLESILFSIADLELSDQDKSAIAEQKEKMLKQAVELNPFAGIPFLAEFYFTRLQFGSVIELAGPYLEHIVHIPLAVYYAESCVYDAQPEKLLPLIEQYRELGERYSLLVAYFEALYDFSQGVEHNDALVKHMQEVAGAVRTDLANLINLQISLNSDNLDKISSSLETIMQSPPFYDLKERAIAAVYHYLRNRVLEDPEFAGDPGRMLVKIAQLTVQPGESDPFLMRILVSDMVRRDVLSRQDIEEYLAEHPDDPFLLQVAAEYALFNGKPEECVEYTERFFSQPSGQNATAFAFLHMLAMEVMGKVDEAAQEYTALVEKSEMDREILFRYFKFCIKYERLAELTSMAERLNALDVPDLKALAPFFQAEALLLQGRKDETLSLLETAQTDNPDFALHAANLFSSCDMLDQALAGYLALVGRHPDQRLVLANLAEVYMAKGMNDEALAYAKRSWETNPDDVIAELVYAKMLAAQGLYQDAERILKLSSPRGELPAEVKAVWTDIMVHCVREDLENQLFWRAFERSNRYLLFFPDDAVFLEFKARAEEGLRPPQDTEEDEEQSDPAA